MKLSKNLKYTEFRLERFSNTSGSAILIGQRGTCALKDFLAGPIRRFSNCSKKLPRCFDFFASGFFSVF